MFSYCRNSPANCSDPFGCRPAWERGLGNSIIEYTDSGTGGTYRRMCAVNYAKEFSHSSNSEYYSYKTDCANFVSQCLRAGGILPTKEWHMNKTRKTYWYNPAAWFSQNYRYNWDVGPAWSLAQNQFDYFSNLPGNSSFRLDSSEDIHNFICSQGVKPGDLLYFANENGVHHATIITKVDDQMIYYAGHTRSQFDEPLGPHMGSDFVYIVKISD